MLFKYNVMLFLLISLLFCVVVFGPSYIERILNGWGVEDVEYQIESYQMKSTKENLFTHKYLILHFKDGSSEVIENISNLKIKKDLTSTFHAKKYSKTKKIVDGSILIYLKEQDYKHFNQEFVTTFNKKPLYEE